MTVSPGSSSWTSKEPGPFSAHTFRATWLIPSNSELQGRSAWSMGEMDSRLPAAKVQPSGPDVGSSCAFSELFKRTFPGLHLPQHPCLQSSCLPMSRGQRGAITFPPFLATGPALHQFSLWSPASTCLVWRWGGDYFISFVISMGGSRRALRR